MIRSWALRRLTATPALVDAAKRGDITGVGLLAEIGYDVDVRRIGQAALHVAAYAGNR